MAGPPPSATADLRLVLSAQFSARALDVLAEHCEAVELPAGAALFRRGDTSDALYIIGRGELSVLMRLDGGENMRLRTFGPGTVVGEMGLYAKQPRSADVVADAACRVYKLSAANVSRPAREHPDVATELHGFVVRLLSTRLATANEELRALL